MRSQKGKRKKAGIYFFSIVIHALLVCLLAFPFLSSTQIDKDVFTGIIVQFDQQESTSAKRRTKKKTSNNPRKKAAETKILKPKLEKSREKKKTEKPEKKSSVRKASLSEKKSESLDHKHTLTEEKRRDYLAQQLKQAERKKADALEAEKRKAELEEKAKKEKYEKMKNAFSHLLKNANHETPNHHTDIKLSDESMSLTSEDAVSGTTENISNRKVIFVPKIEDKSQKEGRVVIKICVNADGKVISAKYTQRNSTTTDSYLIDLATKNAKLYRFSKSESPKQCGTVNIDFVVR